MESRQKNPLRGGGKAGSIQSTVLAQIQQYFWVLSRKYLSFSWVLAKVTAFLPLQRHINKEQTKDRLRERELQELSNRVPLYSCSRLSTRCIYEPFCYIITLIFWYNFMNATIDSLSCNHDVDQTTLDRYYCLFVGLPTSFNVMFFFFFFIVYFRVFDILSNRA